jgi:hypothetical protein
MDVSTLLPALGCAFEVSALWYVVTQHKHAALSLLQVRCRQRLLGVQRPQQVEQ